MSIRTSFLALSLSAAFLTLSSAAKADEPVKVVASFSILGDMVRAIGGEHVSVSELVGPNEDAHVFEPTPADARTLGDAELLVTNGLDFEQWLPRLVETAGFAGTTLVATDGIKPLAFEAAEDGHAHGEDGHDAAGHEGHDHDHAAEASHDDAHDHAAADGGHEAHAGHDHGPSDPHAWQDLSNGVVYARNIVTALSAADPDNADAYAAAGQAYVAELEALHASARAALADVPAERRKVVTAHDAFGYFANAYDIQFIAPEGVSTEAEASAADVARIIDQIREEGISAVFLENVSNGRMLEQIASETDATVGGSLYSDALSGADGPAATYLDMMRHNVEQVVAALKTS